ncbi:hypothetical protein OS493_024072 [Desmophyllum pertusum]|uniref:Uncharacterized protein n=1 Tax=Desmophyllum pertusum TaxID=174260 RepID=A0A9X0D380_9CNID|nr:hypothetical protein OS493_024072 [Desmophyllum pertusum]
MYREGQGYKEEYTSLLNYCREQYRSNVGTTPTEAPTTSNPTTSEGGSLELVALSNGNAPVPCSTEAGPQSKVSVHLNLSFDVLPELQLKPIITCTISTSSSFNEIFPRPRVNLLALEPPRNKTAVKKVPRRSNQDKYSTVVSVSEFNQDMEEAGYSNRKLTKKGAIFLYYAGRIKQVQGKLDEV